MKKNVFLIPILAVLISCNLSARTISGRVTNSDNGLAIPGVSIALKSKPSVSTHTNMKGQYSIEATNGDVLMFSFVGFKTQEYKVKNQSVINIKLQAEVLMEDKIVLVEFDEAEEISMDYSTSKEEQRIMIRGSASLSKSAQVMPSNMFYPQQDFNREGYDAIHENGYKKAIKTPLSTFSIDVDAASYSNVRRFLNNGQKPPVDAVRIEEMINYFNYDYPQPESGHPFAIYQELARCPWSEDKMLLHIGLQGEKIKMENLPASNIVFLIDVSGSMNSSNKLPLLKKAFKLLVQQLREEDRVAIVVYAGSSGLALPSTSCDQKQKILTSLERLQSGGSTAGAAGLKLAYEVATENFIENGNNRIILATDGDFNVGQSSNAEMERLIEQERKKGIFMSVLGFGMGNYQDSKMEIIADKGNGNYAYIDNILEAKKVLVNEFGGTLFTIAKDVKIQIEFNPAVVESYRLIGYENRLLNDEDFEDDKKDAGELGSGHTVTALYEIKLADKNALSKNDLKYQSTNLNSKAKAGDEVANIKFRYKKPKAATSILLEETIPFTDKNIHELSDNFKFSAAVAGFGMILRNSEYKGNASCQSMIKLAQEAKGNDLEGYRSEFIQLVKLAEHL